MHPCPIRRCDELVTRTRLMCRHHWFMVPRASRRIVWAAWLRLRSLCGTEGAAAENAKRHYRRCRNKAIDIVNELVEGAR